QGEDNQVSTEEAIVKGIAWLMNNQNEQGWWCEKEELRMLATTEALDALYLWRESSASNAYAASMDDYSAEIQNTLFWLRGQYADNNDYLARKITTLSKYGQNVDKFIAQLLSRADFNESSQIVGWGVERNYSHDAATTALGALALESAEKIVPQFVPDFGSLNVSEIAEEQRYGWVPQKDASIFVSALVNHVADSETPGAWWVLRSQDKTSEESVSYGSYSNSLFDTAAVLKWLKMPVDDIEPAKSYLVKKQNDPKGIWKNDPYLIALSLNALQTKPPATELDTALMRYYVSPEGNDWNELTNDCMSAEKACKKISAAIEKAPAGSLITIAAGTYEEGLITIDKNLSLIGEPTSTIIEPTIDTGGTKSDGWFEITNNSTVDFANIVFKGTNNGTVKKIYSALLFSNGTGGSVDNCEFENIQYQDESNKYGGRGISTYGNVEVSNSKFSNTGHSAIFSTGPNANTLIHSSFFTGREGKSSEKAISSFDSAVITAIYNTVSNFKYGFHLYKSESNTIENNALNECTVGIGVFSDKNFIRNNILSSINIPISFQDADSNTCTNNTMSDCLFPIKNSGINNTIHGNYYY
ncbi:MAG: hypothetical protein D3922_08055, partial [Candidatus Electrothrix sp. AR1]|nr:hypothetical protein [Candidatus Electrothrix sp. AR1]